MTSKALKWSVGSAMGALIIAVLVIYAATGENPRNAFEYLVIKPVPQSVSAIQEGKFRTMDSVFRVLRFNIAASDLKNILNSEGYQPVAQSEMENWDPQTHKMVTLTKMEYLKYWEERIVRVTKLEVHIGSDWQAYTLKDPPNGRKYMFCATNLTEAIFVADAH